MATCNITQTLYRYDDGAAAGRVLVIGALVPTGVDYDDDDSFNYRGPEKLPRGTLSEILRTSQREERITGDLRFDAAPTEAIAIIAELEATPTIEAVSDVRMTLQGGRQKVRVDLTVESWIVSSERRSRRVGGV